MSLIICTVCIMKVRSSREKKYHIIDKVQRSINPIFDYASSVILHDSSSKDEHHHHIFIIASKSTAITTYIIIITTNISLFQSCYWCPHITRITGHSSVSIIQSSNPLELSINAIAIFSQYHEFSSKRLKHCSIIGSHYYHKHILIKNMISLRLT